MSVCVCMGIYLLAIINSVMDWTTKNYIGMHSIHKELYIRIAPFRYFSPHVYFALSTVIFSSIWISSSRGLVCICVCALFCVCFCYLSIVWLVVFLLSSLLLFQFVFSCCFLVFRRCLSSVRVAADVCCCTCRLNILNVRTTESEFSLLFCCCSEGSNLLLYYDLIVYIVTADPYMPISVQTQPAQTRDTSKNNDIWGEQPANIGRPKEKAKKPNCSIVMLPERWLSAWKCKQ